MSPKSSRLYQIGADCSLVVNTVLRHLVEDPATFSIQLVRRLSSGNQERWAPSLDSKGLLAAVRAYLADQPQLASSLLRDYAKSHRRPSRLAMHLAIQLGVTIDFATAIDADPTLSARLCIEKGDVSGAMSRLEGKNSNYSRKIAGDWQILQATWQVPPPAAPPQWQAQPGTALQVLTNSLPFTQSGYTRRSHELLQASQSLGISVAAVTRIGYPVTVGHLGFPAYSQIDGINYHRLRVRQLPLSEADRLQVYAQELAKLVTRLRPAVLHTTTPFTNALTTRAVAQAFRIPWVYEMRGQPELTWAAARPEAYRPDALCSEKLRLSRDKETEMAQLANAVVVLSEVQANDLVERGVAREKISVAPNGISAQLSDQVLSPVRARQLLGLPSQGYWVGSVSSLVGYEGFDTLLEAVAYLRRDGLDVRAALVGDGVSRPSLMQQTQDLGISDYVVFPGKVPPQKARQWYAALDAFCVPRQDTPVTRLITPMKPFEAMAMQRPVIASAVPALQEIIEVPRAGIMVEPDSPAELAKAIRLLLNNPTMAQEFGQSGRLFAQSRTWRANAEIYRNVYNEICLD